MRRWLAAIALTGLLAGLLPALAGPASAGRAVPELAAVAARLETPALLDDGAGGGAHGDDPADQAEVNTQTTAYGLATWHDGKGGGPGRSSASGTAGSWPRPAWSPRAST
jgi:hypothetical protein